MAMELVPRHKKKKKRTEREEIGFPSEKVSSVESLQFNFPDLLFTHVRTCVIRLMLLAILCEHSVRKNVFIFLRATCTSVLCVERGLRILILPGTNDAYVTIQLGKEKYQTSIKERSDNPEWHEECDLYVVSAVNTPYKTV